MDTATLSLLLVAIAFGCYIQTVTGFAFGLIFVGVVCVANIIDLKSASMIVCIIAIINSAYALRKAERHTSWRLVFASLSLALPMVGVGYWLLEILSQNHVSSLRLVLGCVIILASLVLLFPPRAEKAISSLPVFAFYGGLGGLLSGLFSTSGPPLVFQFYRQNMPIVVIRDSLLAFFTITALLRTTVALSIDSFDSIVWMTCAIGFPITLAVTWLGKHYPPKISDQSMRRLVALLLVLTGTNLLLS